MAAITERHSQNGDVTYHVRIRRKGSKAAYATFTRKTDAKAWIHEIEDAMRKGRYFERQEAKTHTLNEAIDRFINEFGFGTYDSRRCHVRLWKMELGYMLLADITPAVISNVIANWKHNLNERGEQRAGNTLNRYITTLSCVLTAAVKDWGWTNNNPVRDVRRQKEGRGRTRFLAEEERSRLLDACRSSYCPFIYLEPVRKQRKRDRTGEISEIVE